MKRELGLFSVVAISLGAMIGSGIFVLPGLATKIAGPAAPLAYLIAGLIVVPAAFAKSEMATAMPEAGGTYVFVDKGMGPLMGTVAGFGVWFSLLFKSAFALVGLGAYLVIFADVFSMCSESGKPPAYSAPWCSACWPCWCSSSFSAHREWTPPLSPDSSTRVLRACS